MCWGHWLCLVPLLLVAPVGHLPAQHRQLHVGDQDVDVATDARNDADQNGWIAESVDNWLRPASLLEQPFPSDVPISRVPLATPLPSVAASLNWSLFGTGLPRSVLMESRLHAAPSSVDVVLAASARLRETKDLGDLINKSPDALSTTNQRRATLVNDPRIRGSAIGTVGGNGSYWVPARIDLDTMVSRIDSRLIESVVIVPGPYTSRLGPGYRFIEFQLEPSPRSEDGLASFGRTVADYNTNGNQWAGRQTIGAGGTDWGTRVSYGHRTGNDYESGDNAPIPSSYNSRDWLVTYGRDLATNSSIEVNYLRLDQTNVEYPGYAFDMDYLVTDGIEVEYVVTDRALFDRLEMETWYNRTRFEGNAQNPSKRIQLPFLDVIDYVGFTDVDSMSTGFRTATTWGDEGCPQWTAGFDMRLVKQELNEIASGTRLGLPIMFKDRNSPIPDSTAVNPGMFLEHQNPLNDSFVIRAGVRGDITHADVKDDALATTLVGLDIPQATYAEVVGTDDYERNFGQWSTFLTAEYEINPCWTAMIGTGYSERAPTLTELYAAQPFMFLLQNGLNTVTGDPRLDQERLLQFDLSLKYDEGPIRAGARGYYSWAWDYITFENQGGVVGPTSGGIEQVSLKYVNTGLATFAGAEAHAEIDIFPWLTPFVTCKYVEGRDHTRNGEFATTKGFSGSPSVRVPGLPRGFFSGTTGGAQEPLPSIAPLESRVGLRLRHQHDHSAWGVEVSVRIVDNQDRVAESLRESPTPGFSVVDLRGFWQLHDGLLCVAGCENIGDRNYQEHFDFRTANGISVFQPGINFYAGTELTY